MKRPADLLRIDVAAELALLCEERLQGSWEVPTELVRCVLGRGATGIELKLSRSRLFLRAPGARLGRHELECLRAALGAATPEAERHRAVVELEGARADALLFLAALNGRSASLASHGELNGFRLRLPGELQELRGFGAWALELDVRAPRLDRGRALAWLEEACAFAPVPVSIDGRELWRGVRGGLFQIHVAAPLSARLTVCTEGDIPRLDLLMHGVVAAQASVPRYPAFHAAVEMAGAVDHGASPAQLRAAVRPHLPRLIESAVGMLCALGARVSELEAATSRRVLQLALEAAARGLRRAEILSLPLLEVRGPAGRRWISLHQLSQRVGEGGAVFVLDPEDDPEAYLLGAELTVLLPRAARVLVGELCRCRFRHPTPRPQRRLLARWCRAVARPLAPAWRRLRTSWSRPLAPRQLSSVEAAVLERLQAEGLQWPDGRPIRWSLCRGAGAPRRGPGGLLLMGRQRAQVRQGLGLLARDWSWLPVFLRAARLPLGSRHTRIDSGTSEIV